MEKQNNILIVDDTPENLQVLSKTLSKQGYKVRGVVKGEMAIKAAISSPPDLILLDIKMPDMNGYQVCEQLKKHAKTRDVPIIFLSALDEVFDKVKGFNLGGVDYITKPFQIEEVLARIEHQLTIQRLQKQLVLQNEVLQTEIQERKKAEERARAASKAKSQFLANMSHELRTPLNAILGFSQVLDRDAELTTKQRDYIGIIHRSSQHLLELINDILDLAKIEAGQMSLNESCFNLYDLLDRLEEMFQIEAQQKQIALLFLVSANVPQYIKTDEQKLRGCLIDLIGNAIKFTPSGNITIAVSLGESPPSTHETHFELVFCVRDTGIGIAPEDAQSLFEAFVQSDSGKQSGEGTGLGLAIARRFVRLMGGDITLTSTLGVGSTFQFNIKVSHAHCTEETPPLNRRIVGLKGDREPYRIAIVDDRRENRLLLAELLGSVGFEIREAEQGLEGLQLWESWRPHLMFMDTRMPVMSGLEATRKIRSRQQELDRHPDTASRPRTIIIALTASAFEDRRGEILAAGSDDFMHKPFREGSIFEIVSRYLGVRYLYEAESPTHTSQERTALNPSDRSILEGLAAMPESWLTRLEEAASKVREKLVLELIDEIPQDKSSLADCLRDLARDFRLDRIADLVEKVRSISESE